MPRFHINDNGEVKECNADKNPCRLKPVGGRDGSYANLTEAIIANEKEKAGHLKPLRKKKRQDDPKQGVLFELENDPLQGELFDAKPYVRKGAKPTPVQPTDETTAKSYSTDDEPLPGL